MTMAIRGTRLINIDTTVFRLIRDNPGRYDQAELEKFCSTRPDRTCNGVSAALYNLRSRGLIYDTGNKWRPTDTGLSPEWSWPGIPGRSTPKEKKK